MGRETDDEREARLKRAGAWLLAELKKRDWSQRYLASQLGVSQQQVSAYVLGRHQLDSGLVPDLARLLGMEEEEVWRKMQIPLPRPFRTDAEAIAWAWGKDAEAMERMPGRKGPRPPGLEGGKSTRVTRKGGKSSSASPGEENAV